MSMDLKKLNELFLPLSPLERIKTLYSHFDEKDILYTSSFGATAIYLLHLISQARPQQKVHFLDTTFHFAETLAYRNMVKERFGLTVVDILPDPTQNALSHEEKMWKTDPDLCCMVNKIVPMDAVKVNYKVWISGLIGYQTHFRSDMNVFNERQGMLKFHPLIDQKASDVQTYFEQYDLPEHPLKKQGYYSIGCSHCTRKGEGRSGRWQGKAKTECGLHT